MAPKGDVNQLIRECIRSERVDEVMASLVAAIGVKDGKLATEPKGIGSTRFGGRPDLPSGFAWPTGDGGPLAFLGQIDLAEVHPFDIERRLPEHGVLTFFVDVANPPWGFDPLHRRQFAVNFFPDQFKLERRDFPSKIKSENRLGRSRHVSPYSRWMLGLADGFERHRLGLPQPGTERNAWEDSLQSLDSTLSAPFIPVGTHQLLGWPDGLHDAPWHRLTCASASAGFHSGRGFDSKHPDFKRWADDAVTWRCLLQVGSDDALYGLSWGDGGTLAFLIRDRDLRQRCFDRYWCVLGGS